MAVETYEISLNTPSKTVWSFIQSPENWLPLLPGYLSFEKLDTTHYNAVLHLIIGPLDRNVELAFTIHPEPENNAVSFSFHSTTDKVTGYGKLLCQPHSTIETLVSLAIEIKLSGKSGILFKPALTKLKTSWSEETLNKMIPLL